MGEDDGGFSCCMVEVMEWVAGAGKQALREEEKIGGDKIVTEREEKRKEGKGRFLYVQFVATYLKAIEVSGRNPLLKRIHRAHKFWFG